MYRMVEVDGPNAAEVLHSLNALEPRFPPLSDQVLETGHWWLLKTTDGVLCGFAGLVPFEPFESVGYLKRAYISPDHRGKGLQLKMLQAREEKARELGWHQLVAETTSHWSAHNLALAGFERCDPEQRWAGPEALYFSKML